MYLLKIFIITGLTIFILACEQIAETTETVNRLQEEGISVNAGVELDGFPEWSMKVVDQVIYLREISFGTVTQCIVLDTSGQTLYLTDWETIPTQDDQRTVEATAEQITECGIG